MARHRHPFTVGLPFSEWPQLDQEAWRGATRHGDLLTGSGPAASWSRKTLLTRQKRYGRWLRYLRDRSWLGAPASVGARLTEENLRAYVGVLREWYAPYTVTTAVEGLSTSIAAMDPGADRSLLKLVLSRLALSARPVRDKKKRLVAPTQLHQLGLDLMAGWQDRQGHDPRLNAMDFRDGLMIAFLALCPVRLENLAGMIVGRHVVFPDGVPRLLFQAEEMKAKRPLDLPWPALLEAQLQAYLRDIHPMLFRGPPDGAPLWPSLAKGKPQLSAHGIYTRITQVTEKHLGRSVPPHLFRDAAATFITELAPEHAALAGAVLQHTGLKHTMKHYVQGQQRLALVRYQEAVGDLVEKS